MARPLKNLSELVLLKRGVSLAGLPERIDSLADVQRFQNFLGGGAFCEELEVMSQASALGRLQEIHSCVDFRYMENFSPVRDETIPRLWPLFQCGDGHVFYFFEPARVFVAHYHDPDKLEVIGDDLVSALNCALDSNPHFIPEDFWPVFWKPWPPSYGCNLFAYGRGAPTAGQFLANVSFPQKPSFSYEWKRWSDFIWVDLAAHLRVSYNKDSAGVASLNVVLNRDGESAETNAIAAALKSAGRLFALQGS